MAQNVSRKIAEKWPQQLGFRVVLRLAQRGRIAFAVLSGRRDLKRGARASVGRRDERAHRIEPDTLLRALGAAGERVREEGVRG